MAFLTQLQAGAFHQSSPPPIHVIKVCADMYLPFTVVMENNKPCEEIGSVQINFLWLRNQQERGRGVAAHAILMRDKDKFLSVNQSYLYPEGTFPWRNCGLWLVYLMGSIDSHWREKKQDPVSRVTGIPGWYWVLGIKCSDVVCLFIARQKLSNALKSPKSKKSLQESTNRASERMLFPTSYL